jgi:two-component system response regulator FixJ
MANLVPDNSNNKVVVIDDDPAMLKSLQFLLESAGYTVGAYSSAVAFLEDRVSQPACLITDLNMPEMTGLELAAKLRTEGSNIPVLLFSGRVSPAIISRAAELGINKVVEKPAAGSELVRFVAAHIESRRLNC